MVRPFVGSDPARHHSCGGFGVPGRFEREDQQGASGCGHGLAVFVDDLAFGHRKAKGIKVGDPRSLPEDVAQRISELRQGGATLTGIADRLNEEGVPTARGGARWYPATVRGRLNRQPA